VTRPGETGELPACVSGCSSTATCSSCETTIDCPGRAHACHKRIPERGQGVCLQAHDLCERGTRVAVDRETFLRARARGTFSMWQPPFSSIFPWTSEALPPIFCLSTVLETRPPSTPSVTVGHVPFFSFFRKTTLVRGSSCSVALLQAHCGGMFYHAVHLLNHGSALESGTLGLHGAQFCALAGDRDAGVVCTCASRVLSCPEPSIVGTTKGLHVDLPQLGNKASVKAFLAKHPNNAYLVCCARPHRFATALFLGLRSFPWIPLSSAWPQADRRRRCPLYLAA